MLSHNHIFGSDRLQRREHTDLNLQFRGFLGGHRLEAGIVKSRRSCRFGHSPIKRLSRKDIANTAAQLPVHMQRRKRPTLFRQVLARWLRSRRSTLHRGGDGTMSQIPAAGVVPRKRIPVLRRQTGSWANSDGGDIVTLPSPAKHNGTFAPAADRGPVDSLPEGDEVVAGGPQRQNRHDPHGNQGDRMHRQAKYMTPNDDP